MKSERANAARHMKYGPDDDIRERVRLAPKVPPKVRAGFFQFWLRPKLKRQGRTSIVERTV
jgi:hypothetical protein